MFSELQYRTPVDHEEVEEDLRPLREDIELTLQTGEEANQTLSALQSYYKLIQQKSDDGTVFCWENSQGDRISGDIHLERTNVIYDIGIAYIKGSDHNDDHKRSSVNMQNAATVFEYLNLESPKQISLAEAQRHLYFHFLSHPRPQHSVLAQLAAAATNLYSDIDNDVCRIWGMYMNALSEYHQAIVHGDDGESHLELSRLEGALKFAGFARDFGCDLPNNSEIMEILPSFLKTLSVRFKEVYNDSINIPDHDELPEIPPQVAVQTNMDNIAKLLLPRTISKELIGQLQIYQQRANSETMAARKLLKQHQLPHALSVNTIDSVWDRIQEYQDSNLNSIIRDIKELSARVNEYHDKINKQVDRVTDVELRKPFQNAVANYNDLIMAASESDQLIFEKHQQIESDPAFRLLKLQKSQLERMVNHDRMRLLLTQLSELFRERDQLLQQFEADVKSNTIADLSEAQDAYLNDLDANLVSQEDLLKSIVNEHKKTPKFQDILNEVELFTKHLHEGKSFYEAVLPKLDKLHQQLKEVHRRLDIFVVDDEKVASLVAMDFEFERVVEALQKSNNDFEQALNSLL